MKHRVVHLLQKYLFNPPVKVVFAIGLAGNGLVDNQFWIISEHGENSAYVRNISANSRVRLKLRDGVRSRWHSGTAHLLYDDDPRARQTWLATQLSGTTANSAAVRFFGTQLLTVRVDLDA